LEDVSHDSINRFLLRERYEPKDLFETVRSMVNLVGGILSIDDTVIETRLFWFSCDNFCLWNREMLIGQDF
jgi:hypothetical protein